MVARVVGKIDDKVGERCRKGRRATIKALPTHPSRPRPYGGSNPVSFGWCFLERWVGDSLSLTHLRWSGTWHPQGPHPTQPHPVPLHFGRPHLRRRCSGRRRGAGGQATCSGTGQGGAVE